MITALAPMDGYTDCAFREIFKKYSNPDLVFTEFVPVRGIIHAPGKLIEILRYTKFQKPVVAQFFGKEPKYFYKAALIALRLGFDGIDINMGCSVRNIVSNDCGAALIKKPKLALKIISQFKKARKDYLEDRGKVLDSKILEIIENKKKEWKVEEVKDRKITVSVKTRIGFWEDNTEEWIKTLSSSELDFISLHARTAIQRFKGKADWDCIKRAVKATDVPIIGNGDVKSYEQAKTLLKQSGCWGVMIGRGSFGKPWVFIDSKQGFKPAEKLKAMGYKLLAKTALEHARLYVKFKGEKRFYEMRKQLMPYFQGFRGAKEVRKKLSKVTCLGEVESILREARKRKG